MTIYPGSSPDFRWLVKANGTSTLQVRYVHPSHGYKGKWQDIPVEKEIADKKVFANMAFEENQ